MLRCPCLEDIETILVDVPLWRVPGRDELGERLLPAVAGVGRVGDEGATHVVGLAPPGFESVVGLVELKVVSRQFVGQRTGGNSEGDTQPEQREKGGGGCR